MAAIRMGLTTAAKEAERDRLDLPGDERLAGAMQDWLDLSPFAAPNKRAG